MAEDSGCVFVFTSEAVQSRLNALCLVLAGEPPCRVSWQEQGHFVGGSPNVRIACLMG